MFLIVVTEYIVYSNFHSYSSKHMCCTNTHVPLAWIVTFGAHAQRGYCSWVVCLSVTQHLTSRVFVCLTKDMTYLTGNEGQKVVAVFAETAPLQS